MKAINKTRSGAACQSGISTIWAIPEATAARTPRYKILAHSGKTLLAMLNRHPLETITIISNFGKLSCIARGTEGLDVVYRVVPAH